MNRRVVVTGLGAVTSLSCEVTDLWKKILDSQSGIHEISLFDVADYKVKFGGDVADWSVEGYIDSKEEKRLDRFSQFALVAAVDAVKDSGIDFTKYDPFRLGAIVGSGIGGLNEIEEQEARLIKKGPDKVSVFTIPKLMLNAASGHISIRFGLRGPNCAVATACASATNAMGDAFKAIRYGEAEVMVTGGSEAAVAPMGLAGFSNMKALSMRNDDPQGASRPFDADRDGFVLAEGAGILVFEEMEFAKARGAHIYGEVLGFGASADAGHITQPDAQGTGAARAMSNALEYAGLNPSEVDYISAHGTSTPLGDKAETIAIKRVFEDHAYKLNVSSTKSQLGHTLGASGGVEMVMCLLAIRDQVAPPTINLDTPDPDCDLNYTPKTPQERPIRRAMNNSFGFGGHNASILVGKL
ncbi:beta-ketoacyl-ACP synthase II [Bythopirellula polymerisocia]|uniref:3-oxoacyl-[acyl-carrier-protein] synthase 2 n=1 Tax=Bythopirellula polymerisocia TaxID=2528003 RepID=A0A5C6CEM8_9BACT|nr:beta-ketoacyl-ACP synthase II [Bythopirellula polymerisocia]TWU21964.1 3-oxoacyl-[acyl-carrier-protein] synthase 2 [Bythopirellula polymerisocia]